jgi:predicted MFS family arabinose efflux permease
LLTAVIGMFTFNYQVVLPPLAKHEFHQGPALVGTLLACLAVGSLVGALWVAHHSKASSRVMITATMAIGVTMIAATFAPSVLILMLLLPGVGFTSMVMVAMATAVCQEETAPELRGRVMALFGIAFLGSTPIGAPIVGWVSDTLGPRAGLGVGAVTALLAGLAVFVSRDRVEAPQRTASPPTEPLVA